MAGCDVTAFQRLLVELVMAAEAVVPVRVVLARLTQTARAAVNPDHIPAELKTIPQWVCWRYALDNESVKKPPYNAKTGIKASTSDSSTWSDFATAVDRFRRDKQMAGIGLALTPDHGITALDLDHVIDPDTGAVDPKAADVLTRFQTTYAEISPSGAGYRLFCYGKPQRDGHSNPRWMELYTGSASRYMTVTGHTVDGHAAALAAMQPELDRLHTLYMASPETPSTAAGSTVGKDTPPRVCNSSERLALALKNPTIAALYAGDTGTYGDRSTAELALALRLMTFADGDEQTVAGWMDASRCQKWQTRDKDTDSYRGATIKAARDKWDGRPFDEHKPQSTDTGGGTGADEWEQPAEPQPDRKPSTGLTWVTGDKLLGMTFAEPVWLLPEILPECGAFIISGKPKAGKSWFVLQLALSVVQGGRFLDRDVPAGAVLYLALEDNHRRLKERMLKLQPDADRHQSDFCGIAYAVVAPTVADGLAAELKRVITGSRRKIRLIILDTLQKIRGNAVAAGSQYALDYDVLGKLKRIADDAGICLLIVHHLRKADSDDVHDGVSGTNGIAGAVDGSLVLVRQRGTDSAVLHVTGRDMPENELGLTFDGCAWTFAGSAAEVKASGEQNEVFAALKPYGSDGATIKALCDDTGKQRRNVSKLLGKLVDAGRVRVRNTKPAPHYAVCDGGGLVDCPKCHGSGNVGFGKANGKCFECSGRGKVSAEDSAAYRRGDEPNPAQCRLAADGEPVTLCSGGTERHFTQWPPVGRDTVNWHCRDCGAKGTYSKASRDALHPVDYDADPFADPLYAGSTTSTHTTTTHTGVCESAWESPEKVKVAVPPVPPVPAVPAVPAVPPFIDSVMEPMEPGNSAGLEPENSAGLEPVELVELCSGSTLNVDGKRLNGGSGTGGTGGTGIGSSSGSSDNWIEF